MNKQTNLHPIKLLSLAIVAAIAIIIGATISIIEPPFQDETWNGFTIALFTKPAAGNALKPERAAR